MTGYVIVVSPDATKGYKADTYPTEDDKLIAVVAMLTNPTPVPPPPVVKQIQVLGSTGDWINIRSGPGTTFPDIGDLFAGERRLVYETQKDGAGNEWVRINADNQSWVCRVYSGVEKAKWL